MSELFQQLGPGLGAFLGAIVGSLIALVANFLLQERRIRHEKGMYRIQNLSKENAKEILLEALNDRRYAKRSFDTLQRRIGLSDEIVRNYLLELNAKRTIREEDSREYWHLKEREKEIN